jgi:hypothetical protein
MDDLAVARALHVAAIVIWIGGVAMVTTVLLPAIRRLKGAAERHRGGGAALCLAGPRDDAAGRRHWLLHGPIRVK